MNANRLLSHFERISDAPDAVDRLRRFILDLAVRGKLVEQESGESAEPSEAPAAVEPFPLPSTWSCVALGGVLHMINGRAFKPSDWLSKGLPIVRIQNLNNETAPFNCCDPQGCDEKHIIESGTFLISWSGTPGTSFGAFIWQRGKAALNQHIFKCLPTGTEYLDRFLQLAINGRLDEMIAKAHGGVGLQHITKGKLEALALPLPPLAEQHRIVAKVDELMQLCDRLEASQKERESRRDHLVVASLNRLSQPADPDESKKDSGFHLSNLNRLSTKPEHIRELRKAILNLAFTNGLTPMRGNSEKVSVGELAQLQNGYAFKSQWFTPKGIRLLRNANVGHGHLDWTEAVCLSPDQAVEYERFELRAGDIVLSLDRPFISTGTKVARVAQGDLPSLLLQRVGRFVIQEDRLDADYLFRWLKSPAFAAQVDPGRSLGVPHISSKNVENAEIPLPPLAEQKRIVAKVDDLMLICDQLEGQLESQQKGRRQLLETLLHEALEGAGRGDT